MPFTIKGEITGLKDVLARLAALGSQTTQSKILRKALDAAAKPMLASAKALVPVKEGWLKRSLGKRTQTYRSTGAVAVIMGPRSGFSRVRIPKNAGLLRRLFGKRKKLTAFGKKLTASTTQRPTKYAHLVELGTKRSRASPFLKPAFDAHKEAAMGTLRRLILDGIEAEARRAA